MPPPEQEPVRLPSQRLPGVARTYWRLSLLGQGVFGVLIALAFAPLVAEAGLPVWLPAVVLLAIILVAAVVVPELRWRHWRYEVRDEEIDLRHGIVTIRRTLVPIRRVQHVDSESGPLQASFDLASVSFHTAAGVTQIPALTRSEAEVVRRRIGELARTRDDT
jgi:uncharacterized protein